MTTHHPFQREATAEAEKLGWSFARFEHGSKHPRIVFRRTMLDGREITRFVVLPSSSGDRVRGLAYVRTNVRRALRGIEA